jgi:hypothetical protein
VYDDNKIERGLDRVTRELHSPYADITGQLQWCYLEINHLFTWTLLSRFGPFTGSRPNPTTVAALELRNAMSVVTNVLLYGLAGVYPEGPGQVVSALNKFLSQCDRDDGYLLGELARVDQHAGGKRAMECHLWAGAFNNLPIDEFVTVYQQTVAAMPRGPMSSFPPRLLLRRQDDWDFHMAPAKDDGRIWHYRDAAQDVFPNQPLPKGGS